MSPSWEYPLMNRIRLLMSNQCNYVNSFYLIQKYLLHRDGVASGPRFVDMIVLQMELCSMHLR